MFVKQPNTACAARRAQARPERLHRGVRLDGVRRRGAHSRRGALRGVPACDEVSDVSRTYTVKNVRCTPLSSK